MPWFFHRPETVTPEFVPDESTTTEETPAADTGYHCAWCGDPPDANGSHGICPAHAADLHRQYDEYCQKRGRTR